jgi:nitrate reductase gamma subunit
VLKLIGELALFGALARGDRWLWLGAWLMHVSLALVVVGHVAGIGLTAQQFVVLGGSPETSVRLSAVLGTLAGLLLAMTLLALLGRRLAIGQLRRLSDPADYFDLVLLLAIVATGLAMRTTGAEIDLVEVRRYVGSLLTLHPVAMPRQPLFVVHFTLVNLLLVWLPFSKLVHVTGAVLSRSLLAQSPPRYPTPQGSGGEARFLRSTRRDLP